MRKEIILVRVLILVKFLLPFLLVHPAYELHRDEFLYYEQGQHLSLGFLENPPLISVLAFISDIFGGSVFMIRFWPAIIGAATMWLTIKMVKEFQGGFYAILIAGLGILFTAYMRIHFLFQPNMLDIFFWSLSIYFLLRFINSGNERNIFYLAIALALGWYSKYSILFLMASLLPALLLTHHRKILFHKRSWLALLVFIIMITPNLLWQFFHNWPLVHHMEELQETQLQHLNRADFLKEQILLLLPVAFVWIGGLIWLLKQRSYRIISYCFIFIIILIMMGSGKGYYTLGAYPVLLAAGGVWADRVSVSRAWLRYGFIAIILLLSLPLVPVLLPMLKPDDMVEFNKGIKLEKTGTLKWEDGQNHLLQQDYADMLGWKELTKKTEDFFLQLPDSTQAQTIIWGENYGLAGGMKYYARESSFKEKVITDNGSFLFWIPATLKFEHLIFLTPALPIKDDIVFQHFKELTIIDSCTNPLSRQFGHKIVFYQDASDSLPALAQKSIDSKRERFKR